MEHPPVSILSYWLKNLPAWAVALFSARLAYKAAMSWKQEFISKRRAEAAEKILTALHGYISELKRCRSADGKYPFDAAEVEIPKDKATSVYEGWQNRIKSFNNDLFSAVKAASISSRIHFSGKAHEMVEAIISTRLIYVSAYNEGQKAGPHSERYLICAQTLCPSKAQDLAMERADKLLRELEDLLLERT